MTDSKSLEVTILLVEDNPGDQDLILEYLERSGRTFHVETAANLSSALKILNERKFNVVFLDLGLPDSVGLKTLKRFISDTPEVPVIVLTGMDDEELGIESIRIGAQDYLVKGQVNTNLLLRSLHHAIERESLKARLNQYNRMLRAIRDINQLTVREKDRNVLIQSACNLLIKNGNYLHAWIIIFDSTGRPMAFAESGLGDKAELMRTQLLKGELPQCCRKAIGCTDVILIKERSLNCSTCLLSQKNSDNCGAAVGLMHEGRSFGVLVMAIPPVSEYSEDELSLIREFALDIGLALYGIERNEQSLRAEEALLASKQKFQSMVNNIGIGVALINKNMEIIELNRTMREWFPDIDISRKPVCYQAFNDPPRERICDYCPTCKTLRDGSVYEARNELFKGGRKRNHRIISSPILNDEGQVTGAIAMVEDITEHLRLESHLRQSQKFESIGTLAGGIAHDFNNILSAIIGFTELALMEVDKGSGIETDLFQIYAAGERAKDLVRQILTFARQSDEELKPVQVSSIAKEVVKFIRSSIPTSIQIKDTIESQSLVMGSATQIHQIFMNLCTNAASAMEDQGGILEIALKDIDLTAGIEAADLALKPGNYMQIKISDTGEGIPEQIVNSIFEPYFTTKPQGEGTGMGLAVVHGIVEKYNGKIFVKSTLGQGSAFTVYLPVTIKSYVYKFDKIDELPSGTERILLVDDEAPIATIGQRILESLGYSVITRTSSVEALELFHSKPADVDLVITDMAMPNMAGDRLASALMAIRPDIPVILCTGHSKKLSEESALAMGIKALLYKPVAKTDMAKTVRRVLDETKI